MHGPCKPASGRVLLGLLVAASLFFLASPRLAAAQLGSHDVTFEGKNYVFYVQVGKYILNNSTSLYPNITSSLWWGNSTAAVDACNQINNDFGYFEGDEDWGLGPYFMYGPNGSDAEGYAYDSDAGECLYQLTTGGSQHVFVFSQEALLASPSPDASPSASPEASPEASPSPSPAPLDCSRAAFSPSILSSAVIGQICVANKAVRQGKPSRLVTNVTLSLRGANNRPATINITDIVTNKATAGWQCKCRPTKRDNCTCLPNAVLLGGGSFLVMPQWRRNTRPGNIVDTTLQVSFTATASGGDTCTGTAVICSAWNVPRNKPPPVCTPFNSTGVARPALTCI